MAIVNVTEYPTVAVSANGNIQIPSGPPSASYDIAVGGSTAAGATFQPGTKMVRLNTDVTCRVIMGVSPPTALAASSRFSAGQTEYWGVPSSGLAIAVIQSS
jgi:hypothetical protein